MIMPSLHAKYIIRGGNTLTTLTDHHFEVMNADLNGASLQLNPVLACPICNLGQASTHGTMEQCNSCEHNYIDLHHTQYSQSVKNLRDRCAINNNVANFVNRL